ncbi:MAG TPA: isocitrate lyase/phosphoenolpyruvate mutase family protein [Xanthobacteraceae bacterium]|nr:isocitrate lyase/phosphoenolpyruvate mutase family protein [Xanthobacteraceae bacterium]
MPSVNEKCRNYRKLHESGCFVIPNPWDVGSARYLQHLGFKALASTSAGYAFVQGLPDHGVGRDMMLGHLRELSAGTDLPVNADFENGYAHEPDDVAENVRLCIDTGVAGLSIEDSTGDHGAPLYDFDKAVARVRAARNAIDAAGGEVVFTARAECFLVGRPDLDETIKRLKAYADIGADCLYAPGLRTREQIEAVVKAVAPKPVNFLMSTSLGFTVSDVAAMGVRRISVGGTLARVGWGAVMRAAKQIMDEGRFDSFADASPHVELNAIFGEAMKRSSAS